MAPRLLLLQALLISATKLAGLLFTITVTANAVSYSRFKKKNLNPIHSPIHDDDVDDDDDDDDQSNSQTLATFNIYPQGEEEGFFFGLATAPAHVEDRLNDAWLQFAEEDSTTESDQKHAKQVDVVLASASADNDEDSTRKKRERKPLKISMEATVRGFQKFEEADRLECDHHIAAWHNIPHPEERLRFWSEPDTELKLAKDTGISVFRMGVDWSRIMPVEPVDLKNSVNWAALERYKWIIQRVHSYGMKVMLTLFHHSLPPWAGEYGGWKMEKTVDYFMDFTRLVVDSLVELVDYWVTFNEPHIFCMLTYCAGAWPGGHPDMLEVATSALPMGVFQQAMHWIEIAHFKVYDHIHEKRSSKVIPKVGVAHHVSFVRPYGLFDVPAAMLSNSLTWFPFIDAVSKKLDFIGINYYGQEVISGPGLKLVENDEYSESGRGIYPDGLYRVLLMFHERYKHLGLPFIITENGVSDATDTIRRPYLLEHLLALYAALLAGIRVLGYLFWTASDNWEWADGYGPKFGLVAVDRANNLARIPRPSYFLFSKIARTGKVTKDDRENAWDELQFAAREGRSRPFYRQVDKHGLMYAGGLDFPTWRKYVERDWRFGHYEMDGLQDPVSCFLRLIASPLSQRQGKGKKREQRRVVIQTL